MVEPNEMVTGTLTTEVSQDDLQDYMDLLEQELQETCFDDFSKLFSVQFMIAMNGSPMPKWHVLIIKWLMAAILMRLYNIY
jgi:hypothetical protein